MGTVLFYLLCVRVFVYVDCVCVFVLRIDC
jgi:hypothetical protein